ncbi:helix-turn-helix domain-containing protein [Paraburkholderia sp. Cy-641]|uniref:TniQ family protein n=1 Tax=Paraburkholderia sp. Cy-641 TaxID=2608337 RepID=UPI00141D8813|nr:TniQ family protein [Paraburkholderia sp. Cy-641]NIF81037.1 helix-turn-helix domain-containing protein [Paraburkholderia sp. Cy-641]
MTTLLVRPAPIDSESATGYLLRLAEANGYTSLLDLDLLVSNEPRLEDVAGIGALVGTTRLGKLRGAVTGFRNLKMTDPGGLDQHYWNGRRPRYCPACLAANSYWRAQWDITLVTACPIHCVELCDSCSKCNHPLSWKRASLAACDCGASLGDRSVVQAQPGCVAISRYISSSFETTPPDGIPAIQPPLNRLRLADFLAVCVFLGGYAQNDVRKPTKIADLHDVAIAISFAQAAGNALDAWPSGYRTLLRHLVSKDGGQASSNRLAQWFGYFYTALYKRFGDRQFNFLRDEFESHIRDEWPGQLAERNRRFSKSTRTEHKWISLTTAGKTLGVKRSMVCSFIERGMLCGQLHTTATGRTSGTVRRDTLDELCAEKAQWLTLTEAREVLNISRKGAYALLNSGKLRPVSGPTIDGRSIWRFVASEVIQLAS